MRTAVGAVILGALFCSVGGAVQILGATDTGILADINPLTGIETPIGAFGNGLILSDIAWNPISGGLYGINLAGQSQFYSVDPYTGTATLIGSTGVSNLNALTFSSNGVLYAAGGGTTLDSLYTINTSTGAATLI